MISLIGLLLTVGPSDGLTEKTVRPSASPTVRQSQGTRLAAYLVTFGPGPAVWERFGHNALWIRDTVSGENFARDLEQDALIGRLGHDHGPDEEFRCRILRRRRNYQYSGGVDTTPPERIQRAGAGSFSGLPTPAVAARPSARFCRRRMSSQPVRHRRARDVEECADQGCARCAECR